MPLFQSTTVFDAEIESATSEYNTSEDWQVIIDICDKIKTAPNGPKEGLKSIMKRISHRVPHVSMQAVTLLAACVNNCGKQFHLEICSREWINEARTVLPRLHTKVADKLKENIEQWAEEFKNDPQLNLMSQFYRKLKSEGVTFPSKSDFEVKKKTEKGEIDFKEDLDLAIALSLQDAGPPSKTVTHELYPTAGLASLSTPQQEPRKVRALYDFEAAEDNELSFKAGEIILVSDDSDQNWWKGENARGSGLFPSNFVTSNLDETPPELAKKEKKKVRFSDEGEKQQIQQTKTTRPKTVISEEKVETCLAMLKNASPTEEDDEEETIRDLEVACNEMTPLVQNKIEESEKKRTDYEDLNQKFIQAITLYQQCMKEPIPAPTPPVYGSSPKHYQQLPGMPSYSQSAYQPQMLQQMVMGSQLPPASAQPGMQYAPSSTATMQRQAMDTVYASQGPPSLPMQQYTNYQQPAQSTGYTESAYYANAQPVSMQDSYAQSQQGMVYDYAMASQQQQQQHGQMYSRATVYQ